MSNNNIGLEVLSGVDPRSHFPSGLDLENRDQPTQFAKPAPAGEDVPDLRPGGLRNAFRKGLRTFSARLTNIFRKTCERVSQVLRKKFRNTALPEKSAKPNFAMISIELRNSCKEYLIFRNYFAMLAVSF
ncbi:hypothetical protein PGT21_002651 [Puccinia graminis f. sp. tritici]|uniref:Uncharacterized protein n=1 Tax=Puccinia graminis f. sp. tritici TaxID=56615 RepID=A0A5B0MJW3_PUCGR|nr:hypothetical protein PGTUg99_002267 [Puccinia graminis f. sp. tritici]KAA1080333.1 hypothetical protein PGT21_002651 [Puccinia graminis f. sp. tritici]